MSKQLAAQALSALQNQEFAPARDAIIAYGKSYPLASDHYMIRGYAEMGLNDWKSAAATFREATRRYAGNDLLWSNLGLAQQNLKENAQATISFERSLKINPNNGVASGNLANLYRQQRRYAEAESLAQRACVHHPDKGWALNVLGLILADQYKYDAARPIFEQAIAAKPNDPHMYYNLANTCVFQRNFDKAWSVFAEGQKFSDLPRLRLGEGLARILKGDYEKGWPLYEVRLEYPNGGLHAQPPCPRYNGEDVKGKKILLIAEQGFGDVIQFCRFGQWFVDRGAEPIWVVQDALLRLFRLNLPGTICPKEPTFPEADYYLSMMSIPFATNQILPDQWGGAPYLKAPEEGPALPEVAGEGPKIGLVWAGSPSHEKDHQRSIPLNVCAPLWKQKKLRLYAPVVGDGLSQLKDQPITRLDPYIKDFADTAFLLRQLDGLITVDTSVAHLAAALGVKTWMMISYAPDWRWGLEGETTPWYHSMKIIRQQNPGDWSSVINRLLEENF
jgi:tetratricopeptide (TPR) repeat protein